VLALSAAACTYDFDAPFRCSNGAVDGDETDLDCGGSCEPCSLTQACSQDADCVIGGCRKGVCGYEPVGYWSELGSGPPARRGAAFAPMADGRLVLWSGTNDADDATPPFQDTWVFDDGTWTEHTGSLSPEGQAFAVMALDRKLLRALLLKVDGETWSFGPDGSGALGWKQEGSGDPGRRYTFMGYDEEGQTMFVYGGLASGSATANDLLARSSAPGSSWTDPGDTDGPQLGRWGPVGGFDHARRQLLVFGGRTVDGNTSELMEYDVAKKKWTISEGKPSNRYAGQAAFDEERGVLVVFAGGNGGPVEDDLWEYSADDGWRKISPRGEKPPGLYLASMAYDAKHHRVILYGGSTVNGSSEINKVYSYSVLATSCALDDQCGTKHCVDGVCCATPCAEGLACNLPEDPGFCVPKTP
jgi:hypothetical protein